MIVFKLSVETFLLAFSFSPPPPLCVVTEGELALSKQNFIPDRIKPRITKQMIMTSKGGWKDFYHQVAILTSFWVDYLINQHFRRFARF